MGRSGPESDSVLCRVYIAVVFRSTFGAPPDSYLEAHGIRSAGSIGGHSKSDTIRELQGVLRAKIPPYAATIGLSLTRKLREDRLRAAWVITSPRAASPSIGTVAPTHRAGFTSAADAVRLRFRLLFGTSVLVSFGSFAP